MIEKLKQRIMDRGGFVNAHAHLDRANTADYFDEQQKKAFLHEKWKLVDKIKKNSNYWEYKVRIDLALDDQLKKNVTTVCSFIDVDSVVSTSAMLAAVETSRLRRDVCFMTACQTLKGVLDQKEVDAIESSLPFVNIIGSLPGADKGREAEHLDVVMGWAKRYKKRLHVHVDQLNTVTERETELLARKTMQHGLENRVTAIHSISLACHTKSYREEIYKMSKDAGLSFISCPSAWIDHPRREDLAPIHNAITPVDELIEHDLVVALGTDNINDVYKPYCDGDMMFELRLLLEACKIYDEETLVKIATTNGRKVLGLF